MSDEESSFLALLKQVEPADREEVLRELKKIAESFETIDEAIAGQ